jgi:hypothetical protein
MSRRAIVGSALAGSFRNWRLWLIQVIANPILFALFAVWLLIPVANRWYIVLNVVVALFIAVSIVVLHAGTLNYFHDRKLGDAALLKPAFGRALRNILAVAVCIAVFYFLWTLMDRADAYSELLPAYIRSTMPAALRRHVTLTFLQYSCAWIAFAVRWLVIPGLVLPFTLAAAELGFRAFWRAGFAMWRRAAWCLRYWLVLALAVLVGVIAAQAIIAWTPNFETSTLGHETSSIVVRVIVAYALGLWAWMLACSVVGVASVASEDSAAH